MANKNSAGLNNALRVIQDVIAQRIQLAVPDGERTGIVPLPTATEHFALIILILSSPSSSPSLAALSSTFLPEIMKILIAVIPKTSAKVAIQQFKQVTKVLVHILHSNNSTKKDHGNDGDAIVLLCLRAMAEMMLLVSFSITGASPIAADWLKATNCFLSFLDDSREKIRKLVHQHILQLFSLEKGKEVSQSYMSDFFLEVLKGCNRSRYERSMCVIMLLEAGCLVHVPSASLVPIFEAALKLQECGVNRLTAIVYKTFDSFFQLRSQLMSTPSLSSKLSPQEMEEQKVAINRCFQTLLRHPPSNADMEANCFYSTSLASGVIYLCKSEQLKGASMSATVLRIVESLSDLCESDFLQVHCAVGAALKRINSVVLDEKAISQLLLSKSPESPQKLILEGVSFPTTKKGSGHAEFVPSLLHRIESLLQLKLQLSWPFTLDVIRSLFDTFKNCGAPTKPDLSSVLGPIVTKLADIYQAVESLLINVEPGVQVALEDTLGSALRCCGVSQFLKFVPFLPREASSASPENIREWVISVMHKHLRLMPCQLADFALSVLPAAGACKKLILEMEKPAAAAVSAGQSKGSQSKVKLLLTRINQLWSLLPDFCIYSIPRDLQTAFPKLCEIFERVFVDETFRSLIPHILTALTLLGKSVNPSSGEESTSILSNMSLQSTASSAPVTVLKGKADHFLMFFLKYIEGVDIGEARFQTAVEFIAVWIRLASPSTVASISKKLLQLILSSTAGSAPASNPSSSTTASAWMAVLLAIIPCLSESLVVLTYKTVRPLLLMTKASGHGLGDGAAADVLSLQKRAYSVLQALLTAHKGSVAKFEPASPSPRLAVLGLISESLLSSHVSSRHLRFRCMESLLDGIAGDELSEAASLVLGEALICLKDANKKSRDGAFDVLRLFIGGMNLSDLTTKLCSALVAETSAMRSAAVAGLCMLFLDKRSDDKCHAYLQQLLPAVSLLLCDGSLDQTKAVLSYLRVCSSLLPVDQLRAGGVLELIVSGFTRSLAQGDHKAKLSSRSRAIMRKLVARIGEEEVRAHVPEEDLPLLDYVCRQNRRTERKKAATKDKSRQLDRMLGSDSEDEDDGGQEDSAMEVVTDRQKGQRRRVLATPRPRALPAATASSSLMPSSLDDLLEDFNPRDPKEGRRAPETDGHEDGDEDEDYRVEVTADGRVVVKEKEKSVEVSSTANHSGKKRSRDNDEEEEKLETKQKAASDSRKKTKLALKEPGIEYRSSKAGGDVVKKGMLEPHAFIPLDARLLSKKNYKEAVSHFGVVVKGSGRKKIRGKEKGKRSSNTIKKNRK